MRTTVRRLAVLAAASVLTTAVTAAVVAAPASASAIHDFEIVSATSNSTSGDKPVTAYCPEGKKVIGTGWSLSGAVGHVHVSLVSASFEDWVTVWAYEDNDGTTEAWTVTARAMCAEEPPGYEIVSATDTETFPTGSVTATCPDGKHLLGTGFGNDAEHDLVLGSLRPTATGVTATFGWDEDYTSDPYDIHAYAICADDSIDIEIVSDYTDRDDTETKIATAVCPGTRAIGGGISTYGGGDFMATMMKASSYDGAFFFMAKATEHDEGYVGLGFDDTWSMGSYAICALAFDD